jgi:hypothetical protein
MVHNQEVAEHTLYCHFSRFNAVQFLHALDLREGDIIAIFEPMSCLVKCCNEALRVLKSCVSSAEDRLRELC